MGTLHFSIGEDLGIRLAEIARDHIYRLDVEKALSIWKDAFGCPDNLTNRLTTGQLVVTVDDPVKCIVNVCERSELSEDRQKEYPEITRDEVVRIIEKFFRDYVDEENEENWDHLSLEISNVTRMVSDNEKLEIPGQLYGKFLANIPCVTANVDLTIPARYAAKAVIDSKPGEFESELERLVGDLSEGYSGNQFRSETGVHKFNKIVCVIRHCLNVIENKDKIARMLDFLDENFQDDKNAKYSNSESDCYMQMTNKYLRYKVEHYWLPAIQDFVSGIVACTAEPDKESIPTVDELVESFGSKKIVGNDMLTQWLNADKEIQKQLDDFAPVDITEGYDAGWIAPDGNVFALNGTTGNLLHIQLADEIMEYYHFTKPESFKDYANDYYLAADKGFVKFHHDWVTYEGYDCIRTEKPVPLTKKQIEAIVKYGNACYRGELLFGYSRKKLNVELFKNCSDYTLGQLFGL
jgi:hypothetical protein